MGSWTKSLSLGLKRKGSSRATFVEKGREMKMRSSEERINRSRRFFCCVDFQFSSFLPAAKFTFHKLGCERGEGEADLQLDNERDEQADGLTRAMWIGFEN